jgi:hypothetical protein
MTDQRCLTSAIARRSALAAGSSSSSIFEHKTFFLYIPGALSYKYAIRVVVTTWTLVATNAWFEWKFRDDSRDRIMFDRLDRLDEWSMKRNSFALCPLEALLKITYKTCTSRSRHSSIYSMQTQTCTWRMSTSSDAPDARRRRVSSYGKYFIEIYRSQ